MKYVEIAQLPDSGGFILCHLCMQEVLSVFRKIGKPLVLLFPLNRFQDVSQVCEENYTVDLQMEHLIRLGHRRILYLREEYSNTINLPILTRLTLYYRTMAVHCLRLPPHWKTTYPPGKILSALECSFQKAPTPTAIIAYDFDIPTIYAFLRARGMEPGKDVSVVATDGLPCLNSLTPSVTTQVNNELYSAQCAVSLLLRQRNGDKTPRTEHVLLKLKIGESSAPPPRRKVKPPLNP